MRRSELNAIHHERMAYRIAPDRIFEVGSGMGLHVETFTVGAQSALSLTNNVADEMRRGDLATVVNLVSLKMAVASVGNERLAFSEYAVAGAMGVRAIKEDRMPRPQYRTAEIDSFKIRLGNTISGNSFMSQDYRWLISALLLDAGLKHFDPTMVLRIGSRVTSETHDNVKNIHVTTASLNDAVETERSLHSHIRLNPDGTAEATNTMHQQVVADTAQRWAKSTLGHYGATVVAHMPTGAVHRQLRHFGTAPQNIFGR